MLRPRTATLISSQDEFVMFELMNQAELMQLWDNHTIVKTSGVVAAMRPL